MVFHDGELAVQRRAGVRAEADRLSGMLGPPDLDGGPARFLGECSFAVLTARDALGRLWSSPLAGEPGFLDGAGTGLRIRALPVPGDPLREPPTGQPVGLLVIDFARRRRMRVNGRLRTVDDGLTVEVEQAYGNCPKFIHRRPAPAPLPRSVHESTPARPGTALDAEQIALVERADTFFLGTTHPEAGVDASHRGGPPGFVQAEPSQLWWPDYPGNNMFNSLGNLAVDPAAAALFVDFATGATLHLSGTAALEWVSGAASADDGGSGRQVRLRVRDVGGNAVFTPTPCSRQHRVLANTVFGSRSVTNPSPQIKV